MLFNMFAITSMFALALLASAAPANLARAHAHDHAHNDNLALATRADGTKVCLPRLASF